MTLRTIIIDDEPSGIRSMERHLENYPDFSVVATTSDSRSAYDIINTHQPDVVFLDIDMPYINGLEIAKLTSHIPYQLIFVTGHEQYAINAFETQASDYLLKPVSPARLKMCIEKLQTNLPYEELNDRKHRIILNDGKKQLLIPIDSISIIESIGRYQKVTYVTEGEKETSYSTIICEKTMDVFESQLSGHAFYRIHRCFIVNIKDILVVERNDRKWFLSIRGQTNNIPISRSRINGLKSILDNSNK